ILQELMSAHLTLEKFEIAMPSLDEIFIEVVKNQEVPHE
ncbi:MAG: DUF4162 domain-containing protein, partial [Anaerolineaceae bacterium]|nr:DUF4162 domain-containing protein [Anaerolineaceae bacterium]